MPLLVLDLKPCHLVSFRHLLLSLETGISCSSVTPISIHLPASTIVVDRPSFQRSTKIVQDRQGRATTPDTPTECCPKIHYGLWLLCHSNFLEVRPIDKANLTTSIHEVRDRPFRCLRHPPVVESWQSPILHHSDALPPRLLLRRTGAKRLERSG